MAERRYREEETRRIFDAASREPRPRVGPAGREGVEGFTLEELQEIGAEAGLAPERIAEAARALDARDDTGAATRRLAGLPVGVSRTVELPGGFDEDAWNGLVVDLRETFDARGRIRVEGDFREWSNGNLQALVEPTDGGWRLRLRTLKGGAREMIGFGGVGLAVCAVLLVVLAVTGRLTGDPDAWSTLATLALMSAGFVGFGALQVLPWARTRAGQMEEVAARALLRAGRPEPEDGPRSDSHGPGGS